MDNKKSEISTRRSQLSPAKQALLEKRLRGEFKSNNQQKLISRHSQHNPVPLSFSQQRLWFLAELEPDNPFYNVSAVVNLKGKLNFEALQASFQEIINRHEVLRCNFQTIEGKPVAFIHSSKTLFFPLFDISELVINQQKAEVKKLASQEAQQPFDLSIDLLLRAKLLRLNTEEHILLFTMHHIVSDGWSIGVLINELATIYQELCESKTLSLPELPIQYGDFAIWQQDYLQGEALTAQKNYWKRQLGGALPVLQLPTDYPRPAVQSYKGKSYSFALSKSLTTALKTVSQQTGTTLFMTLLTAFKILLYRYSQQEDIIIGTAIANRNLPQIEKLIGFFVNTLVLRTDVSGNPSFLDLLARVKETTLDAYTHQDLPFEKLVEEIQPERNLSHNPLFQIWFSLNNSPMPSLQIGELTLTISEDESETTQFDLSLNMVEQQEELIGIFEYSSDLFNADTITHIAEHFQTLLAGIIANPQQKIVSLPLLTSSEQQQLLQKWNNTEVAYPVNKCIHELFEQQVELKADAVAVVYENQQLTYSELNAKANQLAHYLRSLGVKPEVKVGICLERSLEMVIGLLAILKAGGAYVPLDPAYPQQRLEYILQDTQAPVLLTQASLVEVLPQHQAQIVCLDTDWHLIAQQSQNNLYSELTSENLAYIIYTSGSTGKPKGVQIPHIALSNFLYSMKQAPGLTSQDKLLAVTTYSFDIAALEIFLPIIVGACLIVASQEIISDGTQLLAKIKDSKATLMQATPATWQLLLAAGWDGTEQLKILCGGEALSANLASKLLARCSCVWNMYGPTETTIWSAASQVETVNNTVPISCPIANTQLYILDQYNQLLPYGVAGELHIGGAGLARGYFQRPDLTAEKFIPHPFSDEPSARLYKTGDLARYLPNGEIEYISRIDNQVKVRGFRIELGEIEAVINQQPSISASVVILREDETENKSLVAYITVQPQQTIAIPELRRFLESKLPNYMVPTAIVVLEALPLTPNGKIDRRALPSAESTQLLPSSDIVRATTPIEQLLTSIWAEVLGIEKVGIDNNFFELGGHSLIATRVISQIRQVFQVELPLRCLFEKPTIAQLATEITQAMQLGSGVAQSKIEPVSRLEKLPLSFAQQRLWFLAQLEPDSASYNIPIAVRLQGQLNVEGLQQSFNKIINRHEALRTNFHTIEGQAIAVINQAVDLVLPILDISHLSAHQLEAEVKQQALQAAQTPFDLKEDLLVRVKLLRLGAEEHVLLLTMHHIVSDGWSTGVLVQELATLYQAFCHGESLSPLAPLPIQYVDFAAWQRQWLQGEVLETQMTYWRKQLADAPKVLELPTDYPRPAIQTFRGATYSFKLSHQLSLALNKLSQQQGTTLFMTLLAAFQTLLYRYTGSEDLAIGSAIANRNRAEIDGLIGVFVNTLVLRTNLAGNPSFAELLKRVREVSLAAYAHQDLPFELLVEELQPQRDLSHTPLFQVMFVLQNAPMSALELPNLTLTPLESDSGTAQFDLTLSMTETVEGLVATFEYNSDLFQESTIERMVGHLQTLLEGIVANPQQRLSQLPLLTSVEQQQLLVEWNDTQIEYPQEKCIHELFEAQVELTPDAVAVVFDNQQLSYRELNTKANQLAHYLRSLGVKQEVLVGICVERSLDMAIAILATLKAGGAYVPLDPTYPSDRLKGMVEDAQVKVLLTQQQLIAELPETNAYLVCLDTDWDLITQAQPDNCASAVTPENLAYVIYTSGSTGKPKGAMITHQALVNYSLEIAKQFNLQPSDHVLQFASVGFDVVVEELFPTWISGATVVLLESKQPISCTELLQLINKHQLTVFELPTAYWHQWVYELSQTQTPLPACVRLTIIGGETVSPQQLAAWQTFGSDLIHVYGLTETTVTSTLYHLKAGVDSQQIHSGNLSIGRPIANTQIYILDEALQPVPIGIVGELYIGGVGLGRGYLNRGDITAQRFISHPFSDKKGERLYKTGDLARYLSDGNIECLGRIDHQVKFRGFRIEVAEIEAAINQYPGVCASVVLLREDQPENKTLVAYITVDSSEQLTNTQLRRFLESNLPNYMLPTAFVILNALPLTPNGKVDRRALPIPDATQLIQQSNFVAASTLVEQMLVNIWGQVLGIDQSGVHDNFFDLGGHSLLATRLVSQIRQVFQVELPLRRIFEKTTIAELAQDIEKATKANLGVEAIKIERIERSLHLPLSFAQQRFWFLAQLEMHSSSYNMPGAVRLQGKLNIEALQQSFNEILRRHEALRTNFHTIEGQPVVVILPPQAVQLLILDISNLPANQQELQVQQQAKEEAQKPFDLNDGFLLRVKLLRLSEQEHVLLLTMHHIASDAWSTDILVREFATLYQAFCEEQPAPLAELPIQYVDFGAWQRQWLQGERLESQISYWRKQLEGIPELLELPTDFSRPPVQSFRGATYTFELPQQLSVALNQLSRQQGSTLFMTLLATFQTLLYRYTGSEDIVIGSPIGSRDRTELEGLIGLFLNTLVLRTNLTGNLTFAELLKRVREVALGAYAHQDLPFELLVEELQPQRNLSHTPLFQVMFVLENAPMSALELPGLTLSYLPIDSSTAKFDLTLDMTETVEGLVGTFEYNTDLFQENTIKRMAGHLRTLLEGIVANPQQRLSQLPLLTASEQHQLLREWNDTEVAYSLDKCIHELFATQVERTPDAVAVVYENQQLTYTELNAKANQLAHYLRSLGVKPEVLVGICVERSLEMMIGLLAILKAGSAYIPLDPAYPSERLAFILEDAQVSVLLTQANLVQEIPQHKGKVVCLDADWSLIAQQSQENLCCDVTTENLAYVIYTSGSTGKPKGVQIPHGALSNFLQAMRQTPGLTTQDTLLAVTTISFDIAALELFLPIILGGRLAIASREIASDATQLSAKISDLKATVMQATPATWQLLMAANWQGNHSLKILCGGEALPRQLANQLVDNCGSVWNMYGPTETTIWSSACLVKADSNTVPISHPIANTQFYILDQDAQLVPVGVPGELYIGGEGLARGYLNRPELTAQKFIPNPFNDKLGARLYKTGDLARYLPSGEIEYIGRIDHQVKLRGFRIELGEIEAVINQHPSVTKTVVIDREDIPGQKRLVAYLVLQRSHTLTSNQLRSFLKQQLPDYMIPSAFVELETLPLTPNGKVDRRALPVSASAVITTGESYVAPRTPIEEVLAGIWTEVLGVNGFGIDDNFFELGGHSLLAIQLTSRLREAFGIELPLSYLFESPTIAGCAEKIETKIRTEKGLVTEPIVPISNRENLPLSFAQQRLWFLDQLDPGNPTYNVPTYVRLSGELNIAILERSFNELINRHEALRTVFPTVVGQPVQTIAPANNFTLSVLDLRTTNLSPAEREAKVQRIAIEEAERPFNLAQGPLLRVMLLQLDDTEYVLLLTMHHIISDLWSMGIFVRELTALYQAFDSGESSPLLKLPVQYADFAVWQRKSLQDEVLEKQLAYWKQQLEGAPPVLALPTDRYRPLQPTSKGKTQSLLLPKELSEALKSLSQQEGVTLFMSLLAVYNVLLYYYTQQEDILVGSPIANRNRTEIENLIGFFVNNLVLRTNLSANPSFRELMRRVREVTLEAYLHHDLPFEKLVAELHLDRDVNYHPLFQVWFTLENASTPNIQTLTLSSSDLTISSFEVEKQAVPFDLALILSDNSQGIVGCFEYKTDLFDVSTIQDMAEQLQILLQCVVEKPDITLNQIVEELNASKQQKQLIEEQEYKKTIRQKLGQIKQKSHRQ